jgi:8-amino-7-oxononanoate synthase
MSVLALPEAEFFSDSLNHASLIDGLRLAKIEKRQKQIFPHNDLDALRDKLSKSLSPLKIVVTESLFSMDGDEAPLRELAELCQQFQALLIVDEAHALGVYGERGSGLIEARGIDHETLISINPCGKAMAAAGAFVSGPHWLRQYLINAGRSFIYSTGASPWIAAGMLETLPIIEGAKDRRAKLHEMSAKLRLELKALGYSIGSSTTHIIPILLGSEEKSLLMEEALAQRNILARAIRPPTVPDGECRLRLSLHAGLSNLEPLLKALKEIG